MRPSYARRGDVVLVDNGTEYGCLGVVNLDGQNAACVTDKGIVLVHIKRWKRAWQIG